MFAGPAVRNEVMNNLNGPGNAMNMDLNAHALYNDLEWGIEAKEEDEKVISLIPHCHY